MEEADPLFHPPIPDGRCILPAERGGVHLARSPAHSLRLDVGDAAQLDAVPELVEEWRRAGARLIVGAIAYEAAAHLHGRGCARHAQTPLLILHGYGDYRTLPASALRDEDHHGEWQLAEAFAPEWQPRDHADAIDRIRGYLAAGDCYQVNLAQRLRGRYSGDPLAGWLRLRRQHPAPFAAFFEWDNGALLSASPERFLHIKEGRAVTSPIKGSRPRGGTREEDEKLAEELLESRKDRAENLMIVDLLRNDLGQVCAAGSIHVDALFDLQRFSNVQHLVSTVSGRLRSGVSPVEALLACFPGGSITGAPKHRAMEIIAELEPTPRGFYCGSLFWQTENGTFDSSILIRTLQASTDGTLLCHGGGGIVMDSDPEQEYEESLFKVRALMEAL